MSDINTLTKIRKMSVNALARGTDGTWRTIAASTVHGRERLAVLLVNMDYPLAEDVRMYSSTILERPRYRW
ncbi:MAG: hypothetical protein E6Q97_12460 [Desulfurellales bacterium]|nr:MAG: hypothetical protein E6Q97_12460 [Desulfurellales bacterium]